MKLLIRTAPIALTVLCVPLLVSAAPTDDLGTFGQWIAGPWVNYVVNTLISLTVLVFIYGGFLFASSGPNEQQRNRGRNYMINSVIGIFVIISIWGMVNLLLSTIEFEGNDTSTNLWLEAPEPPSIVP